MNNENKTVQLKIRLSEEDLNQIKRNAKACDKTVSAYVREAALNMCVIQIDQSVVTNHTSEISSYRNAINQLVYTIKRTGNYAPADLEYILEKTNEVLKFEKTFLQNFELFVHAIKKTIGKNVRSTVKSHLSPRKNPSGETLDVKSERT